MLIYIIGSITNDPDYREKFDKAEEMLRAESACDVINPARRSPDLEPRIYAELSHSAILKADAIAHLWTTCMSFGATFEYRVAKAAGKEIYHITPEYKLISKRQIESDRRARAAREAKGEDAP
ncbi:MAG: DUF4406 domain-containing protein [Lentisphaerae bacterium]|jgi:hypothetical protein|nr:DUF4406 domain-containing protein [Lentisphaerota bacterium]